MPERREAFLHRPGQCNTRPGWFFPGLLTIQGLVFLALLMGLTHACEAQPVERILIIAPHPDDESLALGGWLADRIASGAVVSAIVLTDGEAYPKAVRRNRIQKGLLIPPSRFLRLGKTRRLEAEDALAALGVIRERQYLLGYPGNGISSLVRRLDSSELWRSPYTKHRYGVSTWRGQERDPHPYSGKQLLDDFQTILRHESPDILVFPHPADTNADHRAAAFLVNQTLTTTTTSPRLMMYLVHRRSRRFFPQPYGYLPEKGIDAPPNLPQPVRYSPSARGRVAKEKAVRAHQTQLKLGDGFLLSFLRTEEFFWDTCREELQTLINKAFPWSVRARRPRARR